MFFESDFGRVVYDCYTPSNPNGIVVQIAHGMVEPPAMRGCAKSSLMRATRSISMTIAGMAIASAGKCR